MYHCASFKIVSRNFSMKRWSDLHAPKPKVVILGSGWGSYSVLKHLNRKAFDVKVITPRNYFLFTPLLCSTAVGTLEFRSIIEPIRNIGFNQQSDLRLAHAESVDIAGKTLHCKSALNPTSIFNIPYDILVIGVGCLNNTFGVTGVKEHAYFLKDIPDARKIRDRIITNCEAALFSETDEDRDRLLHTVIVGGGPTGVEFGAELYDFKTQDMNKLYQQEEKYFRVTLIEADSILGSFDKRLRTYAEKKFNQRKNFQLVKASVIEVTEDSVILKDGTRLPCGLVVWSTGLGPQPFTKLLPFPKNEKGQVLTDNYLRVLGDPSGCVYALGDCSEVLLNPLPTTGQVAERQGKYLAKIINEGHKHPSQEFCFKSHGMLAYIGDHKALVDLPELKTGFTSWFLWRSAYLTRLGIWRLRFQILVDWLKTFLFGRDTARF